MSSKNKKDNSIQQQKQLKIMKQLDPTNLKQNIYILKSQLIQLINTKTSISNSITEHNQQYMKQTFELENHIKIQQDNIIDLSNKYQILLSTFNQVTNSNLLTWQLQIDKIINHHKIQKDNITKQYNYLFNKVQYMEKYKYRQEKYQQELEILNKKIEITSQNHQKDIQKIKNIHSQERQQIINTTNKEITNIQSTQVQKLYSLASKQANVKNQNQIIQQQIQLCQAEKQILQQNCQSLLQEINQEKLNTSSNQLNGQATQTYQRSLRLLKLQGKLNTLKSTLLQQTNKLDDDYLKMENYYNNMEKQLQLKINKLQTSIKMKDRDNKKVKGCAQMVLNQRSNLQCYLLEVFHQHPQIDHNKPENVNQILRYLFIKINSNQQPMTYKNYLNPTFEDK